MPIAFFPICVALLLNGWSAIAAINAAPEALPGASPATLRSRAAIDSICAAQPLSSSAVGVFAVRLDGDTLASVNRSLRLVPASNVKLITTGAALHTLGEDYRFETRLAYSGSIDGDGVLHGDLYIVGGADPTTGANVPCAEPVNALFSKWASLIREAGIRSIDGRIIGDPRYLLEAVGENLGWTYDDLGTNYGVAPSGLNFFENAQNFLVTPGAGVGEAPSVRLSKPECPWLRLSVAATTTARGSANTLFYINSPIGPEGMMAGGFPIDRRAYTFEGSNRFGAYTCAYYFSGYLKSNGIANDGAADVNYNSDIRVFSPARDDARPITLCGKAAPQSSLSFIGGTESFSLPAILRETNCESDNFFAETLFKLNSLRRSGAIDHASCVRSMEAALRELGLTASGVCQIFDGSGLSRKNYISPEFFVRFLCAMLDSPEADIYLRTLPSPGEKGTLEYKFPSESPEFRARIRMKSGSMNGIRSYSGYILASDGDPSKTIVFSLILNNLTAPSWMVNPVIDSIIRTLATGN